MKLIRPAGLNERRCITRDVLGLYGSIVTLGKYAGPYKWSPEILRQNINKALKQCITQHPAMSVAIQNFKSESPQLSELPEMDLDFHVRIMDLQPEPEDATEAVRHILNQAHSEPLTEYDTRPQWRIYVLPTSSRQASEVATFFMAFACSHALADGMSGLVFHSAFLGALRNVENLEFDSSARLRPSPERSLPLPLEQAAKLTISWKFLLGPLINEYLPSFISNVLGVKPNSTKDLWLGAQARPQRPKSPQHPPTAIRVVLIPHGTLQRTLAVCRRHSVRLTGLVNHLTAHALGRALYARGQTFHSFAVETAIDLRRLIHYPSDCMANYVSVVSEVLKVGDDHLNGTLGMSDEDWEATLRSTETIGRASRTLADQPIGLLQYLSNFQEWTLKKARSAPDVSFDMSNLGVFNSPEMDQKLGQQHWAIEEMVFSQSANGTGAPLGINIASARQGALSIVVTWWPGMLAVDDEERFVQEVCEDIAHEIELISRQ